jgi:hypothetical protein
VGDWFWDYPDEGWTGVLNFKMENRRLTFTGRVEQLTGKGQRGRGKLLYVMSNGTATIIDGRHLELECDTEDTTSGTKFRWRTTEPLGVGFEFAGTFIKVERESNKDDMSIYLIGGASRYIRYCICLRASGMKSRRSSSRSMPSFEVEESRRRQ